MHFFRSSKLHLDCFTTSSGVITYSPVDYAIKHIPDWWRKLPKQVFYDGNTTFPQATMRTCTGMYEYYSKSVCMPMWSDLNVAVSNGEYSWQFSDFQTEAIVHGKEQYVGFTSSDEGHLKLVSPWLFRTKEDVSWIISHPTYSLKKLFDYTVLPGVLNFKHQPATNLQLLFSLKVDKTLNIAHGTPMQLLTPMSNKRIVVHRHLVTEAVYKKINDTQMGLTFINKYINAKKSMRCPYKDWVK